MKRHGTNNWDSIAMELWSRKLSPIVFSTYEDILLCTMFIVVPKLLLTILEDSTHFKARDMSFLKKGESTHQQNVSDDKTNC